MADKVKIVISNFPDEKNASEIAKKLVKKKFVACANIIPQIISIYQWDGKINNEPESLALFKTTADKLESLIKTLEQLHPYEVPEIITICPNDVNPAYANWIAQTTIAPTPQN